MGLLERRRAQEDERRVIISLTPEGRALGDKAADVTRCIGNAIGLSPGEITDLTGTLQRLRSHLDAAGRKA